MNLYDRLLERLPNVFVDGLLVVGILSTVFTVLAIAWFIYAEARFKIRGGGVAPDLHVVRGDRVPTLSSRTPLFDQDHPSVTSKKLKGVR